MNPPASGRVPYLRLVPSVEIEAPLRPVRLGLGLRLVLLVETLRRRRSRALSVEWLTDHERRDVGLPPHRPASHPLDLILRM
ncbi:hypothetical protein [Inquilinus sp. Marseille-Q2685]|uniref:hypothetical protein n=1 Tax=Inquilinus sp. Marseille-Q2685 TaxID=2866581 RepID=UPI001CE4037E|nr:hypothetical protein [Inquilinus sp. Marseille-Q2685]